MDDGVQGTYGGTAGGPCFFAGGRLVVVGLKAAEQPVSGLGLSFTLGAGCGCAYDFCWVLNKCESA